MSKDYSYKFNNGKMQNKFPDKDNFSEETIMGRVFEISNDSFCTDVCLGYGKFPGRNPCLNFLKFSIHSQL